MKKFPTEVPDMLADCMNNSTADAGPRGPRGRAGGAMRHKDREVTDAEAIWAAVAASPWMTMALCDGDEPYAVPLSFGVADGAIYFHSSRKGHKVELLRRGGTACCSFVPYAEVVRPEDGSGCKYSMRFMSVLAWGRPEELHDPAAVAVAVRALLSAVQAPDAPVNEDAVGRTAFFRLVPDRVTASRHA
ncbi:MAG TPA: pyridoxamine 5'-phosphate oxidase [Desulfovibrio sp.]|nr:pyridoxamine 5'-phosphate oxidase [Desulfovibrio sp.]